MEIDTAFMLFFFHMFAERK